MCKMWLFLWCVLAYWANNPDSDLYEMHLPLLRHILGDAVDADMDPIQLAFDSPPDKRLAPSTTCSILDRPQMVGRSPSLA